MKKWLCVYLLVNVVFAKNSLGIFDNYFTNEEKMRESLAPSFNCDLESNSEVEVVICCATSCGMTREPTVIFLDNFFTSYYHLIMQHTPKDRKQEIKRIAKEAMKQRDSIDIQQCVDNALNGTDTLLCIDSQIVEIYYQGLYDITQYLLANDKNLFAKIFKNPKMYQILLTQDNIEVGDMWDYRFFGTFYQDNLIDKTGRLIVKVDSK